MADSLFDLTLEELGQLQVDVASSTPQDQVTSPASVTVYDRPMLSQLNRFTLADLADITPGYSSYYLFGERVFHTRGQKAGSFENNKHVVLVDGIPINHARAGKASTEQGLPLTFAQRVEFLRGPDSTLHGTGAFYGVVQIKSRELKGSDHRLEYANDRLQVSANHIGEESGLYVSHYQKNDSRKPVGPNFSDDQLLYDRQDSQFIYAYGQDSFTYGQLKYGLLYLNKRGGLGEHWMGNFSTPANDLTWSTRIPFIQYEFSDGLNTFTSSVWLNQGIEKGFWAPFTAESFPDAPGSGGVFDAYEVKVLKKAMNLNWKRAGDHGQLLVGVSAETNENQSADSFLLNVIADDVNDGDDSTVPFIYGEVTGDEVHHYGLFSNYEYRWNDVNLYLGARLDTGHYQDDEYEHVSPKFSLVFNVSSDLTAKISFRSALRAPGIKEYSLNEEAKTELKNVNLSESLIEDLKPETFQNSELNVAYRQSDFYLHANVFYNETSSALDSSQLSVLDEFSNPQLINRFTNSDTKVYAKGAELEFQSKWLYWNFNGNVSYAKAISEGRELADVPDYLVNLWGGYSQADVTSTVLLQWQHGYRNGDDASGEKVVRWDWVHKQKINEDTFVGLTISNLMNRSNYLSLSGERRIPLDGRRVLLTLERRFAH